MMARSKVSPWLLCMVMAHANSDFSADIETDPNGKYVLLSTCEYVYEDARYVLHGMLVPFNED